jgi:hypothetical protein
LEPGEGQEQQEVPSPKRKLLVIQIAIVPRFRGVKHVKQS